MEAESRRLTVLSVLPFVMMAAVTVAHIAAGPAVGFLPLVSLGPAFAPLTGSRLRTACVGGIALLLLCIGLGWYNDLLTAGRGFMSIASVLGVTAAGLVAVSMRQEREAELASVRSIAEAAQRVLLKPVRGSPGGYVRRSPTCLPWPRPVSAATSAKWSPHRMAYG
jgi:hypothetical protein